MLSVSSIVLGQDREVYKFDYASTIVNGKLKSDKYNPRKIVLYEIENGLYQIEEHYKIGLRNEVDYTRARLVKKEEGVLYLSGTKEVVINRFRQTANMPFEVRFDQTYKSFADFITKIQGASVEIRYYNE